MQSCASCPLEAMKDFTKADVFHLLFYLFKNVCGCWAEGWVGFFPVEKRGLRVPDGAGGAAQSQGGGVS